MKKLSVVLILAVVAAAGLLFLRYGPYLGLFERDQPHPQSHDDLLVRVQSSAGMGTLQSFFSDPPDLVVTGDGTAYVRDEGSRTGLVEPMAIFHLDEGGVQSLLKRASHDRLLADHPPYPSPGGVSDGGTTSVLLATSNGTWTHSAYALEPGFGFGARSRLGDFIGATSVLVAHAHPEPYRPTALSVLVVPSSEGQPEGEAGGPHWPSGTGVDLATLGECSVVTAPGAIRVLTESDQSTYSQHGTTYTIAAAVSLPGDTCPAVSGS